MEYEPQKYQLNLRSLRENAKKSQTEIAEHLGIKQTVYSRYERGQNDMKPYQIISLCNYYRISADYLLDLPEGRPYGNNTFRQKNLKKSKFDLLSDEIIEIIYWAETQKHISEEAADILLDNIRQVISDLQGGKKNGNY